MKLPRLTSPMMLRVFTPFNFLLSVEVFSRSVEMVFENFADFNDIILCSVVLILCTTISIHICLGYGTKSAKETMIWALILLLVAVQLYHLIDAALYVPATKFFIYKNNFHRMDCINSSKGGKRPGNSQLPVDINPCYCKYGNNCTIASTGREYTRGSCPIHDSDIVCLDKNQKTVHAYISKLRNCNGGQGNQCTENEPCYPCELEKSFKWIDAEPVAPIILETAISFLGSAHTAWIERAQGLLMASMLIQMCLLY